jgi:D-xylose transport system permease protein
VSTTYESSENPALEREGAVKRFLRATEIDTRMIGMIVALLLIWCIFDIWSGQRIANTGLFGGSFLLPRNLWNLLNQTCSIAIMSTGMVLLIVMRQIDLSVGSMLSMIAVAAGVLQVYQLGPALGVGHPAIWIAALVLAVGLGTLVGAFNGFLTAYFKIPAFIVTLGGLIAYKGIAFLLASGETVAPLDRTFKIVGGNVQQSWLGPFWSWLIAIIACIGIAFAVLNDRRQRIRFKFPLRPVWAEFFLVGLGSAGVLGAIAVLNSYPWPPGIIMQYAKAHNITLPAGIENSDGDAMCMAGDKIIRCTTGFISYAGIAVPVLITVAIGFAMNFIATRTSFGRYIYATGGNPEAAELAGINTKALTVKVFALMGALVGISAVIASARLDAATNSLGQSNELYVIAAAVVGGTSLAGGVGTIYGAMLGALLIQSIISGMTLLNLPAAYQDITVGAVLVVAVWLDQMYRRAVK